jgi:adenylate cyclase
VRHAVERVQSAGEIFVGWAQAAVIGFFAVLYTISPKAFPPDAGFQPVPWTLGFYALFTALRLALAYRGRLKGWFVGLSVVVDISVLMVTIWSFHLQYQAPPALYLKASTIMYAFIFIALRTLRFEPRYVVLAGGCAALGWLGLFLYAVYGATEAPAPFTHNYVVYATSYRILGGAEIDKILSILAVTAILALALKRARALLVSSAVEQAAASQLARFFAPEIAEQIRGRVADPAAQESVRRDAAVLMVDLRGFTALSSRLSPAELIALLRDYQTRLVPVIQRHGGSIDKYLGDGILASFGAVVPNDTYAADLCRAIDELAAAATAWQTERTARGLAAAPVVFAGATGEVTFGTIGDETRLEYTVIGEVVNLVAKLEKQTKQEHARALVTRAAYALATAQGYAPRGTPEIRVNRSVDGLASAVDLVVWPDAPLP